jgi:hypothetical protein
MKKPLECVLSVYSDSETAVLSGVGRSSRDWTARFAAAGETERDDRGWAGRPSPSTIDWETS